MKGNVTKTGYWPDSPDRNNDFNIIPSNNITMEGMDMPLLGISNTGDKKLMMPGKNYKFKGELVMETPTDKGMFLGRFKQVGGQLVPHDISVPNLSRQQGGPVDWESVKNPELAAKAKAMGHNTIADYRNSNWGYGKNMQQQADTNTAPIARITDPAFQEELAYQEAKNKLALRQQLESAQARNEDNPNLWEVAKNMDKGEQAIREMHTKYADDKRLSVKEDRANEEAGKFLIQQGAQKFLPPPIAITEDVIGFPNQVNQWVNAQREAEAEYGNYTDELKGKVDAYEKAHGTYQPGLMDKVQALMPNKKHGGSVKRVKIKSLPNNWKSQ